MRQRTDTNWQSGIRRLYMVWIVAVALGTVIACIHTMRIYAKATRMPASPQQCAEFAAHLADPKWRAEQVKSQTTSADLVADNAEAHRDPVRSKALAAEYTRMGYDSMAKEFSDPQRLPRAKELEESAAQSRQSAQFWQDDARVMNTIRYYKESIDWFENHPWCAEKAWTHPRLGWMFSLFRVAPWTIAFIFLPSIVYFAGRWVARGFLPASGNGEAKHESGS